jgi:hypothetical protein
VFEFDIHTVGAAEGIGEGRGGVTAKFNSPVVLQARVKLNKRTSSRVDMAHKTNISFSEKQLFTMFFSC